MLDLTRSLAILLSCILTLQFNLKAGAFSFVSLLRMERTGFRGLAF